MTDKKPDASLIDDLKHIISKGRGTAYRAASKAMIATYWTLGKRIVEEEQKGITKSELYGKNFMSALSLALNREYGKAFSERKLY